MAILILMILIPTCTVFGVTVNGCPFSCSCEDTTVTCINRGLTTVPSNVPNSTTIVNLKHNHITRIDANSLNELSALKELYLQSNNITRMADSPFKGLSALTKLHLHKNQIVNLEGNIFEDLSSLKELWLGDNKIVTLDVNIFNGLTALVRLQLDNNKIATLGVNLFKGLSALTILYLDHNQIVTLQVNVFNGLVALKYLYLSYNQIVTLDVNVFKAVSSVERLELGHNNIATIEVQLFKELLALRELWLRGNPFDCSMCKLKTLKNFLRNSRLIYTGARCKDETNELVDYNFTGCKESETTTEFYPSFVTTEYQARTTESTTGIINTEIILIFCGICLLLLLNAGIGCFCVHKKCKTGHINRNVNNDNVDHRAGISPNVSTNGGSEYAEIEEIQMSNIIVSPLEQRNLIDSDISSDSSADGIQAHEESRRTNTNVYQSLQRSSLNESRLYSSLKSVHLEEILDEPI